MLRLIASRVATGVPTLLAVSLLVFAIVRLIPGDPARLLAGDFATEDVVAELRAKWRLDDPWPVQYAVYVAGVARGDLGRSIATSTPILPELAERFRRTLELAVAGILVAIVVGGLAGIVSAVRRSSLTDYLATTLALTGISTPIFWSGLLLILLFSVTLGWVRSGGFDGWSAGVWTGLRSLLLPAIALGLFQAAVLVRATRSAVLDVLREDYVRTARAKGARERAIVLRHALPNALLPVITISGVLLGFVLGGSVAVEQAFGVPGLGRALVVAIVERDIIVVQNLVLLYAAIFVVVNVFVDLSYALLDPRIRY